MTFACRRLRICVVALALLQVGALFAAPVMAACCASSSRSGNEQSAAADECCPTGSHPPGQCPMHRSSRSTCRMSCAAHRDAALPVLQAAVLPAAIRIDLDRPSGPRTLAARDEALSIDAVPDSPPPRA
jgi:hypothetical protein